MDLDSKVSILVNEFENVNKPEAAQFLEIMDGNLDGARQLMKESGKVPKKMQQSSAGPVARITGPPNATTKTADEIELEKAMARSLQDMSGGGDVDPNADPELAQALLLSKQESGLGGSVDTRVIDLTGESGGDDLQATLLASIKTAQGLSPIVTNDPTTLARQGDLPVGLKNVGNTCYLNSLIQTYFMIPVLRKAVISYQPQIPASTSVAAPPADPSAPESTTPAPAPLNLDTDPNHAFMLELQKLFCAMVLSNQRFVDPSNLLKKIVDDQGKPVSIGAQEDVSEFNDLFMTRLTKGLDLMHPPSADGTHNPLAISSSEGLDDTDLTNGRLQRMFLPNAIEILKSKEVDGSPIEQTTPIDFGRNFILPVNEETDLFTSLDQFMSDDVSDWETPSGGKAPAQRWKWLRHAPEVLFFQQQRATWSGEGNMKSHHKLKFPEVLHMDRYDLKNAAAVSAVRTQNAERTAHLAELTQQIEPYLNFENGAQLDAVLTGTIRYLETFVQSGRPVTTDYIELMQKSVAMLKERKEEESEKLKSLLKEKTELQQILDNSYAEFNSECYKLFAVWVHAGAALGGHYWAYIKDLASEDWYKLNDTDSNRVELPKVLEDGFGGQGVTSAYFLIYMKESLYERCRKLQDKAAGMPEALKTAIQTQNEEFDKKLKEHQENGLEGKMERFVTQYNNKLTQTKDYATTFSVERDMRYYSVFAYLLSIGMEEDMQAAVASEMWLRVFGSGIGKSQNTPQFEKMLTQAVPGTAVLFRAVSLNENEEDRKRRSEWDAAHLAFRSVFMFTDAALKLLSRILPVTSGLSDAQEAMRYLSLAYTRNLAIVPEICQRRDLEDLLRLSVLVCLREAINYASSNLAITLTILDDITYVVLQHFDILGEPVKAIILDSSFTTIPERNPAFVDDPKAAAIQERLINGLPPTERRWESYQVPRMPTELSEWETLVNNSRDTYNAIKTTYAGFLASFGLPDVRSFGPYPTAPSQIPLPQNTNGATEASTMDVTESSKMDLSENLPSTPVLPTNPPHATVEIHVPANSESQQTETPHMSSDLRKIEVDVPPANDSAMEVDDPNKQ